MATASVYKNFVGGQWEASATGKTFENRNPANTDEVVGLFQRSNADDADRAVQAAKAAFKTWRLVPAPKRAEILFRAGQLLIERKERYAREMTREMGKPLPETLGDVQEAIDMLFYTAGEGRRMFGHTTPSELENKFQMSVRQPVGVCALITPWNFPMAIPSWKIVPALVCGNAAVIKPATDTPLSVFHLVQTLVDAGLPEGVLNVVAGSGKDVGEPLVTHPDVDLVSFTGSTETGRHITKLCAPTIKKHSLEMGGKNPIIVMDDADLELALDGSIWSAFGTTGQRCTAASRIIMHEAVADSFTEQFVEHAKRLRLGDGLREDTDVGPLINEAQLKKVHQYVKIGQDEGAELLCGGMQVKEGDLAKGLFYAPTVFAGVKPSMQIAQEEIFGPVVSLIKVSSLEEAIDVANDVAYGLSASVFTSDVNRAMVAARDLYTGIVYVNAGTIGAEVHLPFGGTKGTGNGHREAGEAALDIFSEWKAVYVDYSGRLQRAQIDNAPQ
jgi:aldehyde dehydrogenase (NAD+)